MVKGFQKIQIRLLQETFTAGNSDSFSMQETCSGEVACEPFKIKKLEYIFKN
jgi:hypothetical protein